MPLLSQLDLPSATIIAAMVGGTSVAVINFIANFIAKHYESKPQFRELAIKAVPDNWRHHNELKTDLIKAGASVVSRKPLELFFLCFAHSRTRATRLDALQGLPAATQLLDD